MGGGLQEKQAEQQDSLKMTRGAWSTQTSAPVVLPERQEVHYGMSNSMIFNEILHPAPVKEKNLTNTFSEIFFFSCIRKPFRKGVQKEMKGIFSLCVACLSILGCWLSISVLKSYNSWVTSNVLNTQEKSLISIYLEKDTFDLIKIEGVYIWEVKCLFFHTSIIKQIQN